MMPEFISRMSKRERNLALVVGGVLLLLINLFVWNKLLASIKQARVDYAAKQQARKAQTVYMKEKEMWTARDRWVKEHQPQMKNASEASVLLDLVKQVAGKHNVLIENPAIGTGDTNPNYRSGFTTIETKSPWAPLVRFMYDVQQPDSFIVFESVNLAVESSDPTQMRGKFKIARWFAPGAGGGK